MLGEALTSDNPGDALEKIGKRIKRDAHEEFKEKAAKHRDEQDNIVNTEGEAAEEEENLDGVTVDTTGESA